MVRHRPEEDMNVIGHHDPLTQNISLVIEEFQCTDDEVPDIRAAQVTGSRSLIEKAFYVAQEVPVDLCFIVMASVTETFRLSDSAKAFRPFAFVTHQNLFG